MADIDKVFPQLQTKLRKFKEEWGMEFKRRVEERTPVKTGRLQGGWGFTQKRDDIEIYNTVEYASYVEYGTDTMAPRGMMRTTLLEADDITAVVKEKLDL